MTKSIISIAVSKGGQGKTVSTSIISSLLSLSGYKTLLLDLDLQRNLTDLMTDPSEYEKILDKTVTDIITKDLNSIQISNFICKTKVNGLDIIPSTESLEELPYDLHDAIKEGNKDILLTLRRNLTKVLDELDYDYILIDSSPNITTLTHSLLVASDKVLVPLEADNFGYKGLSDLYQVISKLNDNFNRDISLAGIFLTRVNSRTSRFKQLYAGYERELGNEFIPAYVRRSEVVQQSTTLFEPLVLFDKKCPVIDDYINIIQSIDLMDGSHFKQLQKQLKK